MGEAIQGATLVALVLVAWWTAFWVVCGIHMAKRRCVRKTTAAALCMMLGPFGALIVDQLHRARRAAAAMP